MLLLISLIKVEQKRETHSSVMGNHPSVSSSIKGKERQQTKRDSHTSCKDTFILSLSSDRIQVLNAGDKELLLIFPLIRSYCTVVREGWMKTMTYSFKIKGANRTCMIRLMSSLLLSLYQAGWDPLAPVDVARKTSKRLTAICFRKRPRLMVSLKSLKSHLSLLGTSSDKEASCFCLEFYQKENSFLIFHSVPNSILAELVTTTSSSQGIAGVSRAVFSVISDYTSSSYTLLAPKLCQGAERFVMLAKGTEEEGLEDLEVSTIACLASCGYKLSLPISLDISTKIFFFIFDQSDEVRHQTRDTAGTGLKESLSTYRPIVKRSRSSFFRSFNRRESLNKRIRQSLKKKIGKESFKCSNKLKKAWFQQTSNDIGTDYSDEDEN